MSALLRAMSRLGPSNPMVLRAVHGSSRRGRDFVVRLGYVATLVGLVVFTMLTGGALERDVAMSDLAKAGSAVFAALAYGQVIGVCLLAPLFMAGAISSEQSGKTYDILLTTPLSNLQIVLGSLLGRLALILILLASGLPLFAVLLVFGGVRSGAVFEAFAIAACTAVLVGAIAVTLSVLRVGGRKVVFAFVVCVAGYLVGGYGLDRLVLQPLSGTDVTWLTAGHPLLVLESVIFGGAAGPAVAGGSVLGGWWLGQPFEAYVAWTLTVSLLLLLGCSLFVRTLGQGVTQASGVAALPIGLLRALRLSRVDQTRPAREVHGNPIAWREAHTRGQVAAGILSRWAFVVVGVAAALALLWGYHQQALPALPGAGGSGAGTRGVAVAQARSLHALLSVLLLLEVAVVVLVAIYLSAGCVSKEREDGTLDILLTTPVGPRPYVWGKLRGLVRFLALLIAVPVGTLLLVGGYAAVGELTGRWSGTYAYAYNVVGGGSAVVDAWVVLPEAGVLLALGLVPFVALCVTAGMSFSLNSKGVLGAVVPTLLILGFGIGLFAACGWGMVTSIGLIGPMANAFSPATSVAVLVDPYGIVSGFAAAPSQGRAALWIGAGAAAVVYGSVVYGLIGVMIEKFDVTVRKLSGGG
ncbi:MAG: ABC transporter permease subunit [Planctomycetota bacterium]